MSYPELVREKIDENFEEQLRTLKELIAIESVVSEEETAGDVVMPFGSGVQRAFEYMLRKGGEFGLDTFNADNFGGHLQWDGEDEGAETMGIVCHIDTVPLGSGWKHSPLDCEQADGRIYGRGTNDDKGPCIASLFAIKALKDCGIKPHKNIRLILGLDEETDWVGMEKYLQETEAPDFGFTPDADFPAINAEMGILVFDIAKKFSRSTGGGLSLSSIKGGTAANMVADSARAVVNSRDPDAYAAVIDEVEAWRQAGNADIHAKKTGRSLEIRVNGVSAHGAHPGLGKNAISGLMAFLGNLTFDNDDVSEFIEFYNWHIGEELNGESLGCLLEDEASGQTILNVGMIDVDRKSARVTCNVRYPISKTDEDVYAGMEEVCNEYDLGIVKGKCEEPIFISAEKPLVKTLMDVYREHTGDKDSKPLVIGGGTYARAFDNVVAFGARFPGDEDVAHQKDEYIQVEQFKMITQIYADAIYRLTCEEM